ncbi:BRO-N domain-containing protein, partial [Lactobacillus acidophilus]|uniref:BRO-N domain-containing protein n=1 Tax=Lactobacillus acidophilus TaxID=1579 RepID=UPI003F530FE2
YSNTRDALKKHVDSEDKTDEIVKASQLSQNATGFINVTLITESGVYSLIFGSKMPNAKRFKHWVTSEVLPA